MPKTISTTKNILIVAGDPSGDIHACNLIKALKKIDSEIVVTSIGGLRMREVSNHFIYNLVSVGAAGFAEPFKRFFLWLKLIKLLRKYMEEKRPACVIAVDFYGLNHQILGLAAHRKIPAFYYISPQVWATRHDRAYRIARLVKHIFVIFPFEEEIYRKAGANVDFVGHPLLDLVPDPAKPVDAKDRDYAWKIGILPGSRLQEVTKHLPVFIVAFHKIKSVYPNSRGYIFAVPEISDDNIRTILGKINSGVNQDIEIVREMDYKIRSTMDFAFTSSGTATLENGLMGIPMVVAYVMPRLTYEIAKRIIKVPYISLTNILLKKPLVREFIQNKVSVETLSQEALAIMNNPDRFDSMRKELMSIRNLLGEKGTSEKVARKIIEYIT